MAVSRVTLTSAEEKYAPAEQEIEVSVVCDEKGPLVFITVYKGSLDDLKEGRTKEFDVPVLRLHDLQGAIGIQGPSIHTVTTQGDHR